MKAKQILEWIVKESVNGEFLNFLEVPDEGTEEWEQNEEWWISQLGATPPAAIQAGRYLYYYSDQLEMIDYDGQMQKCFTPDVIIESVSDNCYIFLYRMED